MLFPILAFSQIQMKSYEYPYPFFPKDQHCYFGGFKDFYKDFHEILMEKKLKPCENKSEYFTAFVLINPDNTIEILENKSSGESKCSFELTKEVLKFMDKWIPARIDNQHRATIARLPIYMDDLFENYKEGYTLFDQIKKSSFENEVEQFRKDVVKRVDMSDFVMKGKGKITVLTSFAINENGEMDDLQIVKSSGLKEFDEMILGAIKRTIKKKKWEPAKIHDFPIKSRFSLPFGLTN